MQGLPDGVFTLALHRAKTSRWRTLITLIAVFGLFISSSLAVIAQGATPETGDMAEAEQTVVETTNVVTDETTGSTEQSVGETTTGDGATETDTTTVNTAESSSAGTFETSSVETAETGDTLTDDAPPILPNTDWLEAASATDPVALDPGQQQSYAFTHYVTTHRTGTAVHAELRYADGSIAYGWGLSAQAGGGEWAGGDAVGDVTEWGTLVPDTAFTLSLVVTAPAAVDVEQTVSLYVSSTARGETETGVVETGPLATLTVVPPPIPNTDTLAATSPTEPVTLEPGGSQQYAFSYSVTTPRTGTSIVADLRLPDGSPATGWTITAQAGGGEAASGDARVETGEWATLAPGAFALTITVTAPADVTTEQTVSLWIASTATNTRSEVETGVDNVSSLVTITVVRPPAEPAAGPDTALTTDMQAPAMAVEDQAASGCILIGSSEVSSDEYAAWNCMAGAAPFKIAASNASPGWQWAYVYGGDPATLPAAGSLTWNPASLNDASGSFTSVLVFLRPDPATANPSTGGSVTVTLSWKENGKDTTSSAPLNATLAQTELPVCTPTVSANSVDFGTSTWDGTAYPSTSANLDLTISATGESCSGAPANWSIQIGTGGMTGSNVGAIPPDAITYTGGSEPPTGLTEASGPVTLDSKLTPIAIGSAEFSGSHIWNAGLELTPPDDAPPGDYSGTITISVVNGQ
jgi:hypothetical protein